MCPLQKLTLAQNLHRSLNHIRCSHQRTVTTTLFVGNLPCPVSTSRANQTSTNRWFSPFGVTRTALGCHLQVLLSCRNTTTILAGGPIERNVKNVFHRTHRTKQQDHSLGVFQLGIFQLHLVAKEFIELWHRTALDCHLVCHFAIYFHLLRWSAEQ